MNPYVDVGFMKVHIATVCWLSTLDNLYIIECRSDYHKRRGYVTWLIIKWNSAQSLTVVRNTSAKIKMEKVLSVSKEKYTKRLYLGSI